VRFSDRVNSAPAVEIAVSTAAVLDWGPRIDYIDDDTLNTTVTSVPRLSKLPTKLRRRRQQRPRCWRRQRCSYKDPLRRSPSGIEEATVGHGAY